MDVSQCPNLPSFIRSFKAVTLKIVMFRKLIGSLLHVFDEIDDGSSISHRMVNPSRESMKPNLSGHLAAAAQIMCHSGKVSDSLLVFLSYKTSHKSLSNPSLAFPHF